MNTEQQTLIKRPTPTLYKRPDVVATMAEQEQAEQEQAKETEQQEVEQMTQVPDEQLPPEEKSYKKRYGDLRRYTEKTKKELTQEIDRLKKMVEAQQNAPAWKPPKTKEEIEAWEKQFPDVAGVIRTLANERAGDVVNDLKAEIEALHKQIDSLNDKSIVSQQAANIARVKHRHPDFDEVTNTDEFQNWAESKSPAIQKLIFDNLCETDEDTDALIDLIDAYKAVSGKQAKTPRKSETREASKDVNARSSVTDPVKSGKKIWKESEIAKLKGREWEKYEDEIMLANIEGRIEFDVTHRKGR